MLMNIVGFHLDYWNLEPFDIAALPSDFGIYPVLGCFMIDNINSTKYSSLSVIIIYSLITTFLEFGAHLMGIVEYGNGWNIGWTFVSYLIGFTVVVLYRKLLQTYLNN